MAILKMEYPTSLILMEMPIHLQEPRWAWIGFWVVVVQGLIYPMRWALILAKLIYNMILLFGEETLVVAQSHTKAPSNISTFQL